MPTTYILNCSDNTLYTGSAIDIEKRMYEHNHTKKAAHYTKIRRPVLLIYKEEFQTLKEARAREVEIKRLSREEKFSLINTQLSS